MIVETVKIRPSPNRRGEVLELLRSIHGRVQAQPGCAARHIYEEAAPEDAVVLVERWDSDEAFEKHVRSEAYLWILGAMELSSGPPEITFDHVSASEGMSLIERLRRPERDER